MLPCGNGHFRQPLSLPRGHARVFLALLILPGWERVCGTGPPVRGGR